MITFYATHGAEDVCRHIPPVPVLLPASSWGRDAFRRLDGSLRPPKLPGHVTERAADCGGYVATMKWGDYRYSPEQYVEWLDTWLTGPTAWAATMDYCCEREIAASPEAIRERQNKTTAMARLFFEDYRNKAWAWVPTVQGWDVDDYRRHAAELAPLVWDMQKFYTAVRGFRVGVGTLCQRADSVMIRRIVRAVAEELPSVPLHLWGVKMVALGGREELPPGVISTDSAAWNGCFMSGNEKWKQSGMRRQEYRATVALPEYLEKFHAMLATPRQKVLEL